MTSALTLASAGLLALTAFWLPRQQLGALQQEAPSNVPDQKLRFVSCDVRLRRLQNESVLAQIVRQNPDYLILQHIRETDARSLAEQLKMQIAFAPGADETTSSGDEHSGECVLSRLSLTPPQSMVGGGLWTISQVASKKLLIGSIDPTSSTKGSSFAKVLEQWQKLGSPPMVLAGRMPADAGGDPVQLASGWFDGLSPFQRLLPHTPPSEMLSRFIFSAGWSCTAGGTITGYDLAPSWVDASASASATAPTTKATSQPAEE